MEIHKDAEIRQMNLSEKKIAPCRGCFACWNKTPGKCVMTDDMQEGIEGELWADLMIWSFPLSGAFEKLYRQAAAHEPPVYGRAGGADRERRASVPIRYER